MPKNKGEVISRATGVRPASDTEFVNGIAALGSVIDLAKQLEDLNKARNKGVATGLFGWISPSDAQQQYDATREQIKGLFGKAMTGLTLTAQEQVRYNGMIPSRWAEPFGLGKNSDEQIATFLNIVQTDVTSKANAKGYAVYGVSEVETPMGKKKVGETITANGMSGRINADGTITILNQ